MTVSCPDCGSRYLRVSRCRALREKLRYLVGISPLRCGNCGTRFVARTWNLSVFTHSRCPEEAADPACREPRNAGIRISPRHEIGRASCRERLLISVVAVSLTKKNKR